jgi:hypothetical protein
MKKEITASIVMVWLENKNRFSTTDTPKSDGIAWLTMEEKRKFDPLLQESNR